MLNFTRLPPNLHKINAEKFACKIPQCIYQQPWQLKKESDFLNPASTMSPNLWPPITGTGWQKPPKITRLRGFTGSPTQPAPLRRSQTCVMTQQCILWLALHREVLAVWLPAKRAKVVPTGNIISAFIGHFPVRKMREQRDWNIPHFVNDIHRKVTMSFDAWLAAT